MARAMRVSTSTQLIGGPAATGKIGDYRLENGLVAFIIDAPATGSGFALSGGNLVDAGHDGDDLLSQVFTYLDDTFPRQAIYSSLEIISAEGEEAVIRVKGVDSREPKISITTEYGLARGVRALHLKTVVTNHTAGPLKQYAVGDAFQWGETEHYAPGYGTALSGRSISVPWLAGIGKGVSYVVTARHDVSGHNGHSWSDMNVTKLDLPPGGSGTYERWFCVGKGDVASVLGPVFELHGESTGELHGELVEDGSGKAIPNAQLRIEREGKPFATVIADADGRYQVSLPPGSYELVADTYGRSGPARQRFAIQTSAAVSRKIILSPQGILKFEIRGEDGGPLPSRLTILGDRETTNPVFGPASSADGAENIILSATGTGEKAMAPGRYRIIASRGLEYDAVENNIEVRVARPVKFQAVLKRTVGTMGWVSGDFHEHARPSFDSAVSLEDRVLSNVAEGVEVLVGTDHNAITDYAPTIAAMHLGNWITALIGVEATTHSIGHFNCFPMLGHPHLPGGGAPKAEGRTPTQIFDDCRADSLAKVVQVNHPRAGDIGYFDLFGLDDSGRTKSGYESHFDALEVLNGHNVTEAHRVMQDWFHLLNHGFTYTAAGNSDTHAIAGSEAGSPRNIFWLGADDLSKVTAQQVVDAIKRDHRNVVTNGPFIEMTVDGSPIGSLIRQRAGFVDMQLRVQAANWVGVNEIEVFGNGVRLYSASLPSLTTGGERFRGGQKLRLTRDTWLVAVATGSQPLSPLVGNVEHPVTAFALTNPVWVDADGDGKFTPPER